jgi:hypothetical protein
MRLFLDSSVLVMDDVFTLDRPAVFDARKDRPILFSAVAWADVLLALDRADFAALLDKSFCGVLVRPAYFGSTLRARLSV